MNKINCENICILCERTSGLTEANFAKYHKVCVGCRRTNDLNRKYQCKHCLSYVQVFAEEILHRKTVSQVPVGIIPLVKAQNNSIPKLFENKIDIMNKIALKCRDCEKGVPSDSISRTCGKIICNDCYANGIHRYCQECFLCALCESSNQRTDPICIHHVFCEKCSRAIKECLICQGKRRSQCQFCNLKTFLIPFGDFVLCIFCSKLNYFCERHQVFERSNEDFIKLHKNC